MRNELKLSIATAASVAALDQITKAAITRGLHWNETVAVIPGLFNVVNWRNPGAAFGMFREGSAGNSWVLIAITVLVLAVIAALLMQSKDRLAGFALSLIAGGAIGNLIDRLRFGEVVDFLDFYAGSYHWPAFNVADSAITVGVFLSLVLYLKNPS
ncbi:MAG: signal peptidase II [Deltaproteobacteria bacterium]|nr:signal peptidase II [Deltaproteobacteria bacterium]